MRSPLFLLAIAVCSLFFAGVEIPANAQKPDSFCDGVQSTSDTMDCVNKRKQDAQERLNRIYKTLAEAQAEEKRKLLAQAQQSWVIYRDLHCKLEAALTDNPALERIAELSCLAQLTRIRSDVLELLDERAEAEGPREFGPNPRWINVLSHDYPKIYWRQSKWISVDLDCDGNQEQILPGLRPAENAAEGTNDTAANDTFMLAVINNPVNGRPQPLLFSLPLTGEGTPSSPGLCSADVELALRAAPVVDKGDAAQLEDQPEESLPAQKATCYKKALQIMDGLCRPVLLYWNGEHYVLERPVPTLESESE